MYINRRIFIAKRGKFEEAVALLMSAETSRPKESIRISVAYFGEFDTIALELAFDSLAEYEAFWDQFMEEPGMEEFMAQWNELTESGGSNELWRIAE